QDAPVPVDRFDERGRARWERDVAHVAARQAAAASADARAWAGARRQRRRPEDRGRRRRENKEDPPSHVSLLWGVERSTPAAGRGFRVRWFSSRRRGSRA